MSEIKYEIIKEIGQISKSSKVNMTSRMNGKAGQVEQMSRDN